MPKIVTTLSSNVGFDTYDSDAQGNLIRNQKKRILIGGGAGVFNGVYVPRGVPTTVSDSQLRQLKANPTFNAFVKNGSVTIISDSDSVAKAISGLNESDKSAQRTPKSLKGAKVDVCDKNGDIVIEVPEVENEKVIELSTTAKKKSTKTRKKSKATE